MTPRTKAYLAQLKRDKADLQLSKRIVAKALHGEPRDTNRSRIIRRRVVRAANHIDKTVDLAYLMRDDARRLKRLDDVQSLTELIFNLKRGKAHLNQMARGHFLKSLDELNASYLSVKEN